MKLAALYPSPEYSTVSNYRLRLDLYAPGSVRVGGSPVHSWVQVFTFKNVVAFESAPGGGSEFLKSVMS